jgi:hypothetical protein
MVKDHMPKCLVGGIWIDNTALNLNNFTFTHV